MPEFIQKGGVLMYPIFLCSLIALAIFLERLWILRRRNVIPPTFMKKTEELLESNNYERAIWLCIENDSIISRLFLAAIKNYSKNKEGIKEMIEEVGRREGARLGKHLNILSTIASIAPLLGLLGTVLGMIRVFSVITTRGIGEAAYLAGGISEALLTTAAGLSVAIPSLIFFKYLQSKVDGIIMEMEDRAIRVVDILKE